MTEPAITAHALSKRYLVFETPRHRLWNSLWPSYEKHAQEVWALRDVSFEVARGESVGVIGRNGGGKSTLLEILAGTLAPTAGDIKVNGRVSALLELGSGFNPEYTGRDNVIVNGLLLGLTREEIHRRFDEIAAFADIGDAIDRPIRTYSSGMVVRLAFAVQVLTDPDILVVDEALSVGDFFFQQKCLGYIRSLREKGVTLLFVSHDMGTVRDLCQRAIYLRRGELAYFGDSRTAVQRYFSEGPQAPIEPSLPDAAFARGTSATLPQNALWHRAGPGGPLLAVEVVGNDGVQTMHVRIGETIRVRTYFRTSATQNGHVSVVLKNRYDQVVSTVGSYTMGFAPLASGDSDFAIFDLQLDMMLEAGLYSLMVAFSRPVGKNKGERVDDTGWLGPLQVSWDYESDTAPFLGMFGLPVRGELLRGPVAESTVASAGSGASA